MVTEEAKRRFGREVYRLRKRRGLSQDELADELRSYALQYRDKADLKGAAVGHWETGKHAPREDIWVEALESLFSLESGVLRAVLAGADLVEIDDPGPTSTRRATANPVEAPILTSEDLEAEEKVSLQPRERELLRRARGLSLEDFERLLDLLRITSNDG